MTTIIEEDERQTEELDFNTTEEASSEAVAEEEETITEVSQEEIPEKYQGKSVAEVVRMHQEAEKLLGKQSSEVGDLRKVVDSYITTQLSPNEETQEATKVEEVDFFDDPQKAVQQAIDNHPKIKQAEQYNQQYQQQTALSQLEQKHPDMRDIVNTEDFAKWIKASNIRTQLYARADRQYDYEAADELLSNWKERKGIVEQTAALEKQSRKVALKSASTGNVSGTGETSKKIYRRTDIIRLMKNDPDKYADNADEIMKAYQEGRVK